MKSFEEIMQTPLEDIERPKPFPQGPYLAVVQSYQLTKSSQKETPGWEFLIKPIKALEGVDQEALEEAGGLGTRTLRLTHWITENSVFRLKEFIEDCGITVRKGQSLEKYLPSCVNKRIIINVVWTPTQDKKGVYANVDSTAKAE